MSAAAVAALAAVVVLALAMVFAMVRWATAIVEPPPPAAGEPLLAPAFARPAARRWGAVYAALWMALVGAFSAFFAALGDREPGRRLALLLAVAAGWIAFSALLVAFARALARAGERGARAAAEAGLAAPEARHADEMDAGAGGTSAGPPPQAAATPASRARQLAGEAAWLAALLLVIALGSAWPPLQRIEAHLRLHRRAYLAPLAVLAALGLALLLGGAVSMVLARGRPLSRQEIAELERRALRRRLGPGAAGVAVRIPELAVGAEAADGASFAEVKAAWSARAWRVSPRWRRLFLMMLGAACLAVGLFGLGIVLAPAGVKLVLAAALLYAAVRTARGLSRA